MMRPDRGGDAPGAFYKAQGTLLNKFYRRLVPRLQRKSRALRNGRPIISFTFDDFPSSAIRVGGPLLQRHDVRATFYVAMGLMRPPADDGEASFTADDLREVAAQGHEIACHTYSHLDCAVTSPDSLQRDLDRNAAAVAEVLPGYRMTNFAYPYGNVDFASKRLLGERFDTARGIRTGINAGDADMALTTAHQLYEGEANFVRALDLIRKNERRQGWLIFFTHDVQPDPSPFGTRPEELERVLAAARASDSDILTVRDAVAASGVA